jgi:hypothetical protein
VALQFAPLLERLARDYVAPGLPGPANSA